MPWTTQPTDSTRGPNIYPVRGTTTDDGDVVVLPKVYLPMPREEE